MTARPDTHPFNSDQSAALLRRASKQWDSDIVPQLIEYVKLPAKSPSFEAEWKRAGQIQRAIEQAQKFVAAQPVKNMTLEVITLEGRTPVLFFDIPGTGAKATGKTVLLYGHLDKQPEMTGWRDDSGPWTPLLEDGKLYGRGSADDGYAVFAAMAAVLALDAENISRPRCVGLIETCEESGSYDLPPYLDALAPRMGDVGLVVALDSGAGSYDELWATTSLRGLVNGTMTVRMLTEGVHSGDAGGAVPSTFRIARQLLDRIDDSATGMTKSPVFSAPIPEERVTQAAQAAAILGDVVWKRFPWQSCGGAHEFTLPTTKDPVELILNRTWRSALSITGADGLPSTKSAGNVLRPYTALKLSLRIPPTVDGAEAAAEVKRLVEKNTPYNAVVDFAADSAATGWNAPAFAPWLTVALDAASMHYFGKPAAYMGEGGTIPFMGMLGAKFPDAQMLVTGVLGPKSNAHGPNEFLHIEYAKKVTAATALVISAL
ncbi:MAG TPA: M20/M25/M40 family metallo-hydrolase [Casimicrobium huifangae]|jgi:acetylornithine deacetylase/succinyl-diaminopimelate desuccinylase-like protein|uniref:M20/M25/M40 family metallo-hydrolase n=1 Tax=Casimicrobium huifangae TaxID=2591109 RepID=UPI0012EC82E0|nr:M20/M25/M40 family metallo-hydrolase [Casimicrobium huifangae]HOB00318.1 M20/M25/M40 family metallo-hydrolase [Casimicrobium huifangae]HQA32291.1 M20/M25/M40 family metallo-hydrolase [Casimicrobium huifangae]HQD64287.1 M20/M25/M40 family metallo-hydrolase [Casimicrobium huifangae]